jgi:hypothetical protein
MTTLFLDPFEVEASIVLCVILWGLSALRKNHLKIPMKTK